MLRQFGNRRQMLITGMSTKTGKSKDSLRKQLSHKALPKKANEDLVGHVSMPQFRIRVLGTDESEKRIS